MVPAASDEDRQHKQSVQIVQILRFQIYERWPLVIQVLCYDRLPLSQNFVLVGVVAVDEHLKLAQIQITLLLNLVTALVVVLHIFQDVRLVLVNALDEFQKWRHLNRLPVRITRETVHCLVHVSNCNLTLQQLLSLILDRFFPSLHIHLHLAFFCDVSISLCKTTQQPLLYS
jgi:hypothetical protein